MQIRQMGQKVVPDENTHQDEIINDALEVIPKGDLGGEGRELQVEVFSEEG